MTMKTMKERYYVLASKQHQRRSNAYCYLLMGSTMSFSCTFSLVVREERLVFLHDVGEEATFASLTL